MAGEYCGIDYSLGNPAINRDNDTGIHYGIIGQNAISGDCIGEFEPVYNRNCPHCGDTLLDDFSSPGKCPHCRKLISDGDEFPDEPAYLEYTDKDYNLLLDSSGDIWVFKSPYVIRGTYCSPCAPGAVTISAVTTSGPLAYCLGLDWFDKYSPAPDNYKPQLLSAIRLGEFAAQYRAENEL